MGIKRVCLEPALIRGVVNGVPGYKGKGLHSCIRQRGQLSYSKKKKAASRREGGQTEQDTRKRDKVSDQTE